MSTGLDPTTDFSAAVAQGNQLASTQIMVTNANDNLKAIYLTAFNNWKLSVDAGRIPNTNPPLPPNAYVVSPPDANGYQWPVPGTGPVCPVPEIPQDHFTPLAPLAAGTVVIGHWSMSGKWYTADPSNTFTASMGTPPGTTYPVTLPSSAGGPAADGQPHIFQFYPAVVGQGWFLMIS